MDAEFQRWLVSEKGLGEKSARDVLSRCRRIERTFAVSLDTIVQSRKAVEELSERLSSESGSYLKPSTNPAYGVPVVRRAMMLYAEYKSQKVNLQH
jgi:hypothetical protein